MSIKRYIFFTALALALQVAAAPVDVARRLYNEGDYSGAIEAARKVLKKTPRDGSANYFLGAALYASGDADAARAPLEKAANRGIADAWRILATDALDAYRVDEAADYLEGWQKALTKAKKTIPENFDILQNRSIQLRNMMERVESIEVIDSICVDSADFFSAYRLSGAAGRILPADAVRRAGAGEPGQDLSAAYIPQNQSEMLWAAADSTGKWQLFGADILDDGTLDHTEALSDDLGEGGNALYPFLMPDGVTLYFANDGRNSIGGYDIFMTRRSESDGSYFAPQNIGLPYNSTANDYMLAIDEAAGLGWWATDRNAPEGKVNIYIFIPNAVRVNVAADDPNLAARARLDEITLTQKPGTDYRALLDSRLPDENTVDTGINKTSRFALDMGNGRVYTTLADFKTQAARSAMLEALATEMALKKHLTEENALREQYRRGNTAISNDILNSEAETSRLRKLLKAQKNNAVRLENSH